MFRPDFVFNYFVSDATLNQPQLKRLSEHKYNIDNKSILEYHLQPFWNWLTDKLPLWLAPNLITLVGLITNIVSVLILLYYDCCESNRNVPRWVFLMSGVTIFTYSTLDGIDGKQARRTKSATPLGELFDHGCDAFSQILICVQISIALHLELVPNLFFTVCILGEVLFYCAHWQAYVSGKLTINKVDCIEALYCIIVACFITGVFGREVWLIDVFNGITLNLVFIFVAAIPAFIGLCEYVQVILSDGAGKNGSTVAGTSVLSPIFPLICILIPQIMIYYHRSSSTVFTENVSLYCFTFGFVSAKITSKLVIGHLTKSVLQVFDTILWGPGLIFINQYYDQLIPDLIVLIICLIYCAISLFVFWYETCRQICNYLHIECFRIPCPPPE